MRKEEGLLSHVPQESSQDATSSSLSSPLLLGIALQGEISWQWRMHFRYRQNRTALSLLTLFSRIAGLFLLLFPAFVYQHAQRPTNAIVAFSVPSTDETMAVLLLSMYTGVWTARDVGLGRGCVVFQVDVSRWMVGVVAATSGLGWWQRQQQLHGCRWGFRVRDCPSRIPGSRW
jgi:hypothetical protein